MGAESSSLLSGVIIDSSPILTTQDWSLHHAQVIFLRKVNLKMLHNTLRDIAHICQLRHPLRGCTFFKPVYFFPHGMRKGLL